MILVTGAGSGIGRALALGAAALGAQVILCGRTVRKLESVHDAIVAAGSPRPTIAPLDFERAGAEQYAALADAVQQEFGRLDGLAHLAGQLGERAPIEHYDVPTWMRVMHVNLNAAFILTRTLLPLLRESPDASVVFTSSGVSQRGRAYWGAYAAAKFGVEALMQVLADETSTTTNIRVNSVNPGKVRTADARPGLSRRGSRYAPRTRGCARPVPLPARTRIPGRHRASLRRAVGRLSFALRPRRPGRGPRGRSADDARPARSSRNSSSGPPSSRERPRGRSRGRPIAPQRVSSTRLTLRPAASNSARTAPRATARAASTRNQTFDPGASSRSIARELRALSVGVDVSRHRWPLAAVAWSQDAHAVLDRQVAAPAPGRCGERAVIGEEQQAVLGESDGIDRQPSACMEARQTRLHRRAIVARTAAQQLTARLVISDDAQPLRDADAARDVPPIDNDAVGAADALTDGRGTTVHQDPARAYPLLNLPPRAQSVLGEHLVQSFFQTAQRSSDAAGPATSVGVSASDVCSLSSSSSAP